MSKPTPTLEPYRATLRVGFVPSTFDADARTVKVLLYPRGFTRLTRDPEDPWGGELVEETFSLEPGHVRMERAQHGLPLLADHAWSAWEPGLESLENVLGKLDNVNITPTGIEAILRFSQRESIQWVIDDVEAGILDAVSMGALTYRSRREQREGRPTLLTWIDWELVEGSLTPVQAAPGARTQSASRPQGATARKESSMGDTTKTDEGKTEGTSEAGAAEAKPATLAHDVEAAVERGVKLRMQTARELKALGRKYGIADDEVDEIVEAAKTPDAARLSLLNKLKDGQAPRTEPAHGVELGEEAGDKLIKLGAAAILQRVFGTAKDENGVSLYEKALKDKRLAGVKPGDQTVERVAQMALMDIGQELLEEQSGGKINARHFRGLDPYDRAKVVMGQRKLASGMNTVSHFPITANTVVNVGLRQRYMERVSEWKRVSRKENLPNFKSTTYIGAGQFPALLDVGEHGTYQRGSWTESDFSLRLGKGGRIVSWTWELMLADDFNMIGRIIADAGQAARRYEDRKFRARIVANKMSDGATDFFSSANANISAVVGTPSVTTMKGALKKMAAQKGFAYPAGEVDADGNDITDGDDLILRPRLWMLGSDDYTDAEALLGAGYIPTAASGAPTPRMVRLRDGLIEEPFLDSQSPVFSVMFCDPNELAAVQHGHLASEDGPVFDQEDGFTVEGIDFKARDTFYVELVEPKAAVKITRS